MNKIILIGVLIVIVGTGAYFITSKGKIPGLGQPKENTGNNQITETINPDGKYTINELLTRNKPMKCSWTEEITDKGEVTNIIYINGKNFYQDVAMGDMGHAYTVSDGEYLYIWNDFSDTASKMKFSELKTNTPPEQAQGTTGLDQKRDFVCENWTADNSKFNPPQGKNFIDITEEMGQAIEGLQENTDEYKQQACDMCQKAPSQELIDECLQNMQCN